MNKDILDKDKVKRIVDSAIETMITFQLLKLALSTDTKNVTNKAMDYLLMLTIILFFALFIFFLALIIWVM